METTSTDCTQPSLPWKKKHQIRGKTVLFIHTGGTPLFFEDLGVIAYD